MTKVLIDKYPLGSLPNQQTDGRYLDDTLKSNIDVLAEKIVDDLQFLGLCGSSTYEVRSGKSTFMQHIGEYYIDSVNRQHGLNLTFDMNNIVFNSKDLMARAFKLPKYSVLILDENDEVDEHYFSKLARDLRRFFRKSGQLNLFIIVITPNFFQLKSHYAVTRSNFLIDVRFEGKFERGYFAFYSYDKKRELYVKGKKEQNFGVTKPDFIGRFTKGYAVDRDEYLKAKKDDLEKEEEKEERDVKRERTALGIYNLYKNKKYPVSEISNMFNMPESTVKDHITLGRSLKGDENGDDYSISS